MLEYTSFDNFLYRQVIIVGKLCVTLVILWETIFLKYLVIKII